MGEPTIITVIRADHARGWHSAPHKPNQHCPECAIKQATDELVSEIEAELKR